MSESLASSRNDEAVELLIGSEEGTYMKAYCDGICDENFKILYVLFFALLQRELR